ncbi:SUMO-interacting motif-containing protein 1-like [Procambarus clarkii]|uniref:SUMO-interacting motif-containing protein 1-like n=1 Tax=Procambarus clarkii TaxID=6728 RepID=UPI003743A4A0
MNRHVAHLCAGRYKQQPSRSSYQESSLCPGQGCQGYRDYSAIKYIVLHCHDCDAYVSLAAHRGQITAHRGQVTNHYIMATMDRQHQPKKEEDGEDGPGGGRVESPGGGRVESPGGGRVESPGGGRVESPGGGRVESPGGGRVESPGGGRVESPGGGRVESPGGGRVESPGGGRVESPGGGRVESPGGGRVESPGGGRVESPGGGRVESPGGGRVESPGGGRVESPGGGRVESPGGGPAGDWRQGVMKKLPAVINHRRRGHGINNGEAAAPPRPALSRPPKLLRPLPNSRSLSPLPSTLSPTQWSHNPAPTAVT